MSRTGRMGRIVSASLLVAGIAGLGGCNKVNKAEFDAVMRENSELRDRLDAEQTARQEAETRGASVEQENRDLAAAVDKSRAGGTRTPRGSGLDDMGTDSSVTWSRNGSDIVAAVAGDVLFDSGKATLKASAKKTLDGIANAIKSKYSGQVVRVEGYTDSDPIRKSNWGSNERLSGERAMAVEEYLVSRGVSKDQIYYAGFGSSRAKPNKKDSRRVEIVILARG